MINRGSFVTITVGQRTLKCVVKVVYSDGPWDMEDEILNPSPGRGSHGRWKQNVDGGTIVEDPDRYCNTVEYLREMHKT